ncbi:transglutaminase family protein, partial [Rhizobium ruizarguesonis]
MLPFDRPIEAWGYTDVFGNACSRLVAPPGLTTISKEFEIYDRGQPDIVPDDTVQHAINDLPAAVLVFLLGSRYCDTDRL